MGVFFMNWISSMEGRTKNLCLRVSIFTLYLIAGAAIFQSLEAGSDKRVKHEFESTRRHLQTTYGINDTEMERFLEQVKVAIDDGYGEVEYDRWCFMGALLFAATVLTTIGYGHIAPETFGGRLFCIGYAFFGIPLTGLMLKSIGERIMDAIDVTLKATDKFILGRKPTSTNIRTTIVLFGIMSGMILLLASLAVTYEDWTFFEGVYFSFITLSTIGFGDFIPTQPREMSELQKKGIVQHHTHVALFILVTFLYITIGLSVVSSVLLAVTRLFESNTEWDFRSLHHSGKDDDDDDDDEERYAEEARLIAKDANFNSLSKPPPHRR